MRWRLRTPKGSSTANSLWSSLARLGLARAYAEQRDTVRARAGYQDFLPLWKDADPDIPILQQAKAECAKLRWCGDSDVRCIISIVPEWRRPLKPQIPPLPLRIAQGPVGLTNVCHAL